MTNNILFSSSMKFFKIQVLLTTRFLTLAFILIGLSLFSQNPASSVSLSESNISENNSTSPSTFIGVLSVTDSDDGNTHTISLSSASQIQTKKGDADHNTNNNKFTIFESDGLFALTASGSLDYETDGGGSGTLRVYFQVTGNEDAQTATLFTDITIADVNDAPSGTDKTITAVEDTSRSFTSDDFEFTDADGNSMINVTISTLPTSGTFQLSGTNISSNQTISVSDLSNITYQAASNANGNSYATIGFKVRDNGGTSFAGSPNVNPSVQGVDVDQTEATLTILP